MNKKLNRIFIFLFLIFTITGSIVLLAQESKNAKAKVTFLFGKVSVQKSGDKSWGPLKANDFLSEGDTISTGNGSKTTIVYRGSEFKIQQNSRVKLSSLHNENKDGEIEVTHGFAWFKIVALSKGKQFNVITPTAVAGVRGTLFSAAYDKKTKKSSVCTCEGKVSVTNKNGQEILLEKGVGVYPDPQEKEMEKIEYKEVIKKMESFSGFADKIKKNPSLQNCISCHIPKDWTPAESFQKDETYGKM